ncbi:hypothetical protein BC629DRAFT_1443024 [Irpex lacteus]|nr:hypothetical protein BC629DRAFT_1443024 [Irpex lacteus]
MYGHGHDEFVGITSFIHILTYLGAHGNALLLGESQAVSNVQGMSTAKKFHVLDVKATINMKPTHLKPPGPRLVLLTMLRSMTYSSTSLTSWKANPSIGVPSHPPQGTFSKCTKGLSVPVKVLTTDQVALRISNADYLLPTSCVSLYGHTEFAIDVSLVAREYRHYWRFYDPRRCLEKNLVL